MTTAESCRDMPPRNDEITKVRCAIRPGLAHQAAHVNEGLVRINIAENIWQRCARPARGRVEAGSDGVRVPGPRRVKGMNRVVPLLLHTPIHQVLRIDWFGGSHKGKRGCADRRTRSARAQVGCMATMAWRKMGSTRRVRVNCWTRVVNSPCWS